MLAAMADSPDPIQNLRRLVRQVPDFPKPGILFKDLTPLFADAQALASLVQLLVERCRPLTPQVIVGIEARGFIVGSALAHAMQLGFVPVRKPGKLPAATRSVAYSLEYGTDRLEIHADALQPAQATLIVDDLLATGGTAAACTALVDQLGAHVCGYAFLAELQDLGGRQRLRAGVACESLMID